MITYQPFGRTSHLSSRTLLGAAAFGNVTQAEADAAIELAIRYGVNHIDTAASYGDSEDRLGSWIRRHGRPFFLATKTGERTAKAAREQLQHSLDRLGVDQVDLLQLHNLVDPDEWEIALGPGGALEAAIAARDEGLVRFIGITGHGWDVARMHTQALERFNFDSVLIPFSYVFSQHTQYWTEVQTLLQICRARQVAVQSIKAIVRAPWADHAPTRATWYEPLEEQTEIDLAVHWVLGHSGLFVNTVGDIHILPKVLEAASRFEAMPSEEEMQAQITRLDMQALFS